MTYDIAVLKSAQDKLDARRNALVEKFVPFRNELVARLEQFTQEAVGKGLRGVTSCEIKKSTKEFLEATLELNGFELVIVSTNLTNQLNWEDKSLAAKILLYFHGDDDYTPHLEIVLREVSDQPHKYFVRWFPQSEPKPITGLRDVKDLSGQEAANAVIEHFYAFEFIWPEGLTLRALKGGNTGKPLGFRHHP